MIPVEKILAFFAEHAGGKEVFQEELTRRCAVNLGVKARSIGFHSGVKIVSEA